MQLAARALDETPLEFREFQSCAVTVNSRQIPLAKLLIRKFVAKLTKVLDSDSEGSAGTRDQVYQLGVQLFQLTERPPIQALDRLADEGVVPAPVNQTNQGVHV